jgi:hypothetical protein
VTTAMAVLLFRRALTRRASSVRSAVGTTADPGARRASAPVATVVVAGETEWMRRPGGHA